MIAAWWLGASIPLVALIGGPEGDTSPSSHLRNIAVMTTKLWFEILKLSSCTDSFKLLLCTDSDAPMRWYYLPVIGKTPGGGGWP